MEDTQDALESQESQAESKPEVALDPSDEATAPEATAEGEAGAEPTGENTGEAPEGEPTGEDTGEAPEGEPAAEEEAPAVNLDPRFRELVKGINAELICSCPECVDDHVELQWFSPEEKLKTKGQVMLYCQRSSRKYFSPAVEFQAWLAEKPVVKGRGRG